MKLTSDEDGQLVVVGDSNLIRRNRVAVNSETAATSKVALLSSWPNSNDFRRQTRPVALLPLDDVPPNALAIGESLARQFRFYDPLSASWELECDGVGHELADEVTLEPVRPRPVELIREDFAGGDEIAGQLLHVPADGVRQGALTMEVAGRMYRVLDSPLWQRGSVVELTGETRIKVVSGKQPDVEIVLLVDCSGSMLVDDLADPSMFRDASPATGLRQFTRGGRRGGTRFEAARRLLQQIRDSHTTTAGRSIHMALLGFTVECRRWFPADDRLQRIDTSTDANVLKQLQTAIDTIQPRRTADTGIGRALQFAGDYLERYGNVGNDRLIVLVTDGAIDWHEEPESNAGAIFAAVDDPISLMKHEHGDRNITLLVLPVGTRESYERWLRSTDEANDPTTSPNPEFLERLAQAGNGKVGGVDVLDESIRGAMHRASHDVTHPAVVEPEVNPDDLTALELAFSQRAGLSSQERTEQERLVSEVADHVRACNDYSEIALQCPPVFQVKCEQITFFASEAKVPVSDWRGFRPFISDLVANTFEVVNPQVTGLGGGCVASPNANTRIREPYPVASVATLLQANNNPKITKLRTLRHRAAHFLTDKDRAELGRLLADYVGAPYFDWNAPTVWQKAQVAVLRELEEILTQIINAFQKFIETAEKKTTPAPRVEPATEPSPFIGWPTTGVVFVG